MMKRSIPMLAAAAALLFTGCAGTVDGSLGEEEGALSSTLPSLETTGDWKTCSTSGSNCGGANGTGTPVESTFTKGTFAGRTNAAAIWVGGNVSYGTAYWYEKNPAAAYQIAQLEMTTDLYLPVGTRYQAIEWDPQQVRQTRISNFGLQANYVNRQWRLFDYGGGGWRDSGIAYEPFAEGVWHRVRAHYHTDGTDIVFDWIEIDGVRHAVTLNGRQASFVKSSYTTDNVSMGLQLDQDKAGDSYGVYYDNVQLAYSDGASPSTGCSAPTILEPTAGQSVGPAIDLRVSAPSCIGAIKCYLDGNPTPVAAGASSVDQWVSVAMGAHAVQCNGWDASGTAWKSAAVSFTRTY